MSKTDHRAEFAEELRLLEQSRLRRHTYEVAGAQDRLIDVDGRLLLNFSSNNYLGLANHPILVAAVQAALSRAGVGAGGSRLIVGTQTEHVELEKELASFHGRNRAILFNSGYHANLGIIPTLVGSGDTIFSDELNHASLIDGCRLSRARVVVFPHRDVAALERALAEVRKGRKLIVTDSVFSMEGEWAPLDSIAESADRHDALLMVDEAHAIGVIGPAGRGVAESLGVEPDVVMGTLGKGLGAYGAYAVGTEEVIELLANRARSFVFSTSLPAAVVAASRAALKLVSGEEGEELRRLLAARVGELAELLTRLGLRATTKAPIFPIVIGESEQTMVVSKILFDAGYLAHGVRPPTVPRGTARLRVSLMATHTDQDVASLGRELERLVTAGTIRRRAND